MTCAPKSARSSREPAAEGLLGEDVHAHRGEVALRLLGLLLPVDDPVLVVEGEDPHPRRLGDRHATHRDRDVGAVAAVGGHEGLVIHLVDVIAGEDEDRVGRLVLEDVEVAKHGIGGAAIPLGEPPAGDVRLQQLDPTVVAVEVPGAPKPDVIVERPRVVLGQDDDVIDVRIAAVRQREIDDRYFPPKGTAGLARTWERIERRSPSPPARMTAIVRFTGSMLARGPRATVNGMSARRSSARYGWGPLPARTAPGSRGTGAG